MNEIKKIHLGRQAFTISVEAHRALREYVDAIDRQADAEVVKEVELRMAELLTERNITGEKVILSEDIDFLKEQLGEPGDFKDEDAEKNGSSTEDKNDSEEAVKSDGPKQLYRDTENGLIAGVAAGLAAYLSVDAILVRIFFILLALAGGAGVALYILIWILAPEAKTSSDRLKMRGKAITVDSIKAAVDRADIPGAANRATAQLGRGTGAVVVAVFRILLAVIGVIITIVGLGLIFGSIAGGVGLMTHGVRLGEDVIFPISAGDYVTTSLAMGTVLLIGVFFLLAGIAMVRRKWKVPGWAVASLAGMFILCASAGVAYAFNSVSHIQAQIKEARHSKIQAVEAFNKVELTGDATFIYKYADHYSVEYSYLGKRDESSLKADLDGGTLKFDATEFQSQGSCRGFCPYVYNDPDLSVIIRAPSLDHVTLVGEAGFANMDAWRQDNLSIEADPESRLNLSHMNPSEIRLTTETNNGGNRTFEFIGLQRAALRNDFITAHLDGVNIDRTDSMVLSTKRTCTSWDPLVYLNYMPNRVVLNGHTFLTADELRSGHTEDSATIGNCIDVQR